MIDHNPTIMYQVWLWSVMVKRPLATANSTVATGVETVCNQAPVTTGPGNFRHRAARPAPSSSLKLNR